VGPVAAVCSQRNRKVHESRLRWNEEPMAELTAHIDLPLLDDRAATAARAAVRPILQSWKCTDEDWLFDAQLIVTELVTNAIRHGGGGLELMLTMHERSVTVSVADGSAVIPEVHARDAEADGGRGLLLIEALSDAWGVEDHHGGKRVWVRLHESSTDQR
jgi:anti-sigma regulatory factor (Ser/Thr protein kinase)